MKAMLTCLLWLTGLAGFVDLGASTLSAEVDPRMEWAEFKKTFLSPDGRIIDWQNEQRSHSEGQGYALVLAVGCDDRLAFDLIFTWSENNLGPGLRAWNWGRNPSGEWKILDANNATDGDILHAWALLLAGEKWGEARYSQAGADILKLIREKLIVGDGLLLPARQGFADADGLTVNPAYYIFPAFRDFERFDPANAEVWQQTRQKGLALIKAAVVGPTGLLPDWLRVDAQGVFRPPRAEDVFGYEAIRVPLYLAWGREVETLQAMRPLIQRAAAEGRLAEAVRLDGRAASPQEALAGEYAVLARAAEALALKDDAEMLRALAWRKQLTQRGNYYGTVLFLLSLPEPSKPGPGPGSDAAGGRLGFSPIPGT